MRILHLLSSPVFSGPAENVALLAVAQRELGHEVTVALDRVRPGLSSEEPALPRMRELGVLDEGGLELCVKSSPVGMARDALRLRRRTGVDVVHAHFSHDHLLARFFRPRGALLVRSIHAPRSLERRLPFAHGYTVPTAQEAMRFPPERIRVLLPLVAPGFVKPKQRLLVQKSLALTGRPVIGMVSTLQRSRRHALAVDAFAKVKAHWPMAQLVLVGDGEEEAAIRAQVEARGLTSAVHFAGYQKGADFVRWLQAMDEVWVLGLGNDWSGRAAAQARACGVRVVALPEGGLPAMADVLARAPTPEAIAQASISGERLPRPHPSNRDIADDILDLYAWGRRRLSEGWNP